jgi:DNA repair protein RadC
MNTNLLSDAQLCKIAIGIEINTASQVFDPSNPCYESLSKSKKEKIVAMKELVGRASKQKAAELLNQKQMFGSSDSYKALAPYMQGLEYEEFYVIFLNRANKITGVQMVSSGSVSGTVADPKKIFKFAILNNASGIIIAHNHPSGNKQPSAADNTITKKIVDGGKLLDIQVLDHIIYTDNGYYSYADEGAL